MKLVVGLGNPGREYVGTRHNVGFEVIDQLAFRLGWTNQLDAFDRFARQKFNGLTMDGSLQLASGGSEQLLLLKPTTFMNDSGRSVQAASAFYQATADDLCVVLDDIALPSGKIRLRANGSSGGHNGLKDIERALATNQYPRLRLGIDPPPARFPQRDYVLGRISPQQRELIDPAIARACGAIVTWVDKGVELAMTQFNA